jgi:hypothetical protein
MPTVSLQVPVPKLSQALSLARTLIPFVGGCLVMKGVMTETEYSSLIDAFTKWATDTSVLVGMLAPIISAVWGMVTHSDTAVVKAAATVPGVSVAVAPTAADPVKEIAQDPAIPGVELTKPST